MTAFNDGYILGLKTVKEQVLARREFLEKQVQNIEKEIWDNQKLIREMAASGRRGPAQGKLNRLQQIVSKKKMYLESTLTAMSVTTNIILDITEMLEPQ